MCVQDRLEAKETRRARAEMEMEMGNGKWEMGNGKWNSGFGARDNTKGTGNYPFPLSFEFLSRRLENLYLLGLYP